MATFLWIPSAWFLFHGLLYHRRTGFVVANEGHKRLSFGNAARHPREARQFFPLLWFHDFGEAMTANHHVIQRVYNFLSSARRSTTES